MRYALPASAAIVLAATTGCTSFVKPEIVPTGPNSYVLSRQSKVMGWGNLGEMKVEVYREANAFAEKQGKVMVPISINEAPVAFAKYAFFELRFRLEDSSAIPPGTEIAPSSAPTGKAVAPGVQQSESARKLTELKEMLDKGLITQEDFERKKKEILDQM